MRLMCDDRDGDFIAARLEGGTVSVATSLAPAGCTPRWQAAAPSNTTRKYWQRASAPLRLAGAAARSRPAAGAGGSCRGESAPRHGPVGIPPGAYGSPQAGPQRLGWPGPSRCGGAPHGPTRRRQLAGPPRRPAPGLPPALCQQHASGACLPASRAPIFGALASVRPWCQAHQRLSILHGRGWVGIVAHASCRSSSRATVHHSAVKQPCTMPLGQRPSSQRPPKHVSVAEVRSAQATPPPGDTPPSPPGTRGF
jgi:hypothetical protein